MVILIVKVPPEQCIVETRLVINVLLKLIVSLIFFFFFPFTLLIRWYVVQLAFMTSISWSMYCAEKGITFLNYGFQLQRMSSEEDWTTYHLRLHEKLKKKKKTKVKVNEDMFAWHANSQIKSYEDFVCYKLK